ncbi:hypothetical protein HMSSN036_68770 [Paenibacillus macerans]|nr:hypothetical protein HMSSN036_68770 [Paenibacillus macerans]
MPNGVAEVGGEAAKTKTAAAPAEPADSSRQPAGLTPKDGIYAGLFGLWLAGVIALSVYLFRINRRFAKSIVIGSNGMVNPELEELLQSCQHKLGVRRKISLRMTDQGSGPALHALRSPKFCCPRPSQTNSPQMRSSIYSSMNWFITNGRISPSTGQ